MMRGFWGGSMSIWDLFRAVGELLLVKTPTADL